MNAQPSTAQLVELTNSYWAIELDELVRPLMPELYQAYPRLVQQEYSSDAVMISLKQCHVCTKSKPILRLVKQEQPYI